MKLLMFDLFGTSSMKVAINPQFISAVEELEAKNLVSQSLNGPYSRISVVGDSTRNYEVSEAFDDVISKIEAFAHCPS